MSEEENTRIVQQFYDNYKSGDIQALLNSFSDDVEWQLPEIENVAFSGKRRSREAVAQFFALLAEDQEVQQFEPREYIAQGEKVVALGHYEWRTKLSGRSYESEWAHVFRVREGKVVSFQEYTDTAASAAAHRQGE